MAKHDPIFDYDDSKERAAHSAPTYDHEKARGSVLKLLDRAKSAYESATPLRGRQPITIRNGHVELHLPFAVNDRSSIVRSAESFAETLEALVERVKAGAYDEAIKLGLTHDGAKAAAEKTKRRSPGEKREWSPAQRARFNAAIQKRRGELSK